jgi:hypothetical protein
MVVLGALGVGAEFSVSSGLAAVAGLAVLAVWMVVFLDEYRTFRARGATRFMAGRKAMWGALRFFVGR